jgi:hypothetical protein
MLVRGRRGFITGLGGYSSILISVPAAVVVQATTIAAIACLAGDDPLNPDVKAMVLAVIAGDSVAAPIKRGATATAKSLAVKGIKALPRKVLTTINKTVGSRIITKGGTMGAVNLGKAVPLVGGVVGGTADVLLLRAVGKVAIRRFITHRGERTK